MATFDEAKYHERCRTLVFFDEDRLNDIGATYKPETMELDF